MEEETSTRFQLVIPKNVLNEVKKLATEERRSISNMIVVLVMEAVKARRGRKSKEEGNSLPALLAA
jgi:hypothetical protein